MPRGRREKPPAGARASSGRRRPGQDPTARAARASPAFTAAHFERLVATVPGVLFDYVLHPDGTDRFLWVSARSRELLELEPEALQADSQVLWRMVPAEELPALQEAVMTANRAGGRFEAEFRVRLPSGRVRWLRGRSDPEPGPGGPERIWSGILVDTTEQHRAVEALDQERALFRSLIEHSLDLVVRFDREGRARYVNEALRRELTVADVEGKTAEELGLSPAAAPAWREALARALAGESAKCDVSAVGTHGLRDIELLVIPEPGPGGAVESVLSIGRDVTERVRVEQAVREADRRKTEFLAMLSHELRNPLAPIRHAVYILGRAAPGGEQAARAVSVIERQVGQLAHLVDDLLDLTRIERNRIQLQRQRLELNELVRRTAEDHRSTFEAAGVELTVETAPQALFVDGDPSRLAQVVANLLHNAAKFTPRGGRVRAEVARATGERAHVRVSDSGVGMTPGILARLFQPFAQQQAGLARSKGGLGLGLALVKGLVESHGGEVTARSDGPGRGATFEISLPLLERQAAAPEEGGARPGPGLRILVVEDNVDAATTLAEVLQMGGHTVEVVRSGAEALAQARASRPDVVLCDIGLPGMSGYDVARAFREDPELRQVHLVAVSGYALPEDVRQASQAGFEVHVSKPPSVDRLEQVLHSLG